MKLLTAFTIAIVATIAIGVGMTPLDAIKEKGKTSTTGPIDLEKTSYEVFNTSAFTKDNIMQGKHFTVTNNAATEALESEKATRDWANRTIDLLASITREYGNVSASVDKFVASLE